MIGKFRKKGMDAKGNKRYENNQKYALTLLHKNSIINIMGIEGLHVVMGFLA